MKKDLPTITPKLLDKYKKHLPLILYRT